MANRLEKTAGSLRVRNHGVVTRETRRWRIFDDASGYLDRFGLLLIISTLTVVTLSLVDRGEGPQDWKAVAGTILVTIFVGATLLLALRASGVTRRLRVVADIVVSVGVLVTILIYVASASSAESTIASEAATPPLTWIILSALVPLVVVRRLVHHRRMTVQTLFGAVSAYLLIAMAFNFVFLALDAYGSTPFFGVEQPTTSFMYYSLVTITTLGFGDLAAVAPLGRLLSTIEAVIGQVYLVTFVAMIVGVLVSQRDTSGSSNSEAPGGLV